MITEKDHAAQIADLVKKGTETGSVTVWGKDEIVTNYVWIGGEQKDVKPRLSRAQKKIIKEYTATVKALWASHSKRMAKARAKATRKLIAAAPKRKKTTPTKDATHD